METTFSGALTERDRKRHIAHEFEVPPGMGRLEIRLSFAPAAVDGAHNMLCLTLFDPRGFRGAGHRGGSEHVVSISAAEATPGYLPGDIPAGTWSAVIDTHMVLEGQPCRYELTASASPADPGDAPAPAPAPAEPPVVRAAPGWYRGDLHAHTLHSDAEWDTAGLLESARAYGLDFASITDHNTTSHLRGIEALSGDGLLVIGGLELTTFWGHALSLGTRTWVDWRVAPSRTMPQIAGEVGALGGLFVIAHPCSPGDPICTGCDWGYVEMRPGNARLVEIWNGPWLGDSNNEAALALWYGWLNAGERLTATAGTDAHGPAPEGVVPGFNVVRADELSERAVLAAVARGESYLSSGPHLELRAETAAGAVSMGGGVPEGPFRLHASWSGSPVGASVRLVAAGDVADELIVDERDAVVWDISEPARWYVVELRADGGELLAVTNPIFVGQWGA